MTDTIRSAVSAYEAGIALGLNPDRGGRCACPVHHGKDRNCRLDKGEKGYYCFVCHAGGDVIKLVQVTNECDFKGALWWLNNTFRLGLKLDRKVSREEQDAIRSAAEKRKRDREYLEKLTRMQFELYLTAGKYAADLQEQAEKHRPLEPWDEWDEKFVEALRLETEAVRVAEEVWVSLGKKA